METIITDNMPKYELVPSGVKKGQKGFGITKRRVLIGSSLACDIYIPHSSVSAIHAVLEISNYGQKIYDMNSEKGTLVNGKKVVVNDISIGDVIGLGNQTFIFKDFSEKEVLPPALNMLKELPKMARPTMQKATTQKHLPRVDYPLAKDPKAEFSEYIFEDVETLYPIFDYNINHGAIEIIILFNNKIFSVDYLPQKDGIYNLVGVNRSGRDLEFAYLGKEEKCPFVEVKGDDLFIFPLDGYEFFCIGDKKPGNGDNGPVCLCDNDIFRFSKGSTQIFVRQASAPPKVAPAPILRRDQDFKKYLFLVLGFLFISLAGLSVFDVDKEIEKEKVPARIATILYKKKLVVNKNPSPDKTKNAPPKIKQKSPKQVKTKKIVKNQTEPKPKKTNKRVTVKSGSKTAKKVVKSKKVAPNKASVTRKSAKVTPTNKRPSGKKNIGRSQRKTRSTRVAKSQGNVDVYKSMDFKSTISSLMAKGGSTKGVKSVKNADSSTGFGSVSSAGAGATLKTAQVSKNVGSFSGAASGSLDTSKGVEGLVSKKGIFTVGIPAKTIIRGGMDPDVIRRILMEHLPQFQYCYQKALDRSSRAFSGVVKLNFLIGASGHVTKAGARGPSLPSKVRGCVINVLRGIRFPEPMGGGVVEVNQPMSFFPKGN